MPFPVASGIRSSPLALLSGRGVSARLKLRKLGTCLELLNADGPRRVVWIGNELLERLPLGRKASIADPLQVEDGLGPIGHNQAALHEKSELVGETEMGFGVGRKHLA